LPLATGTGIWALLKKVQNAQNTGTGENRVLVAVGIFGILITLALFLYELYGIRKCAALIAAGKRIEILLNIDNGQFRRRPHGVACNIINEPFAAGIIYPTALAAWMYFILAFTYPKANPWIPLLVIVFGFVVTVKYDRILQKEFRVDDPKSTTGSDCWRRFKSFVDVVKGRAGGLWGA